MGVAFIIFILLGIIPKTLDPLRLDEYRNYRKITHYLKKNSDSINGVIVLPHDHKSGSGDRRITNIYYYNKKDKLPVFHLDNGQLKRVSLAPSRGNITMIPRTNKRAEISLESGKYAVLSRQPLNDCENIPNWLMDLKAAVNNSTHIRSGLLVCEFEFAQ